MREHGGYGAVRWMYPCVRIVSRIGYDAVLDAERLDGAPGQFPQLVARPPWRLRDYQLDRREAQRARFIVAVALLDQPLAEAGQQFLGAVLPRLELEPRVDWNQTAIGALMAGWGS